MKIVFVNIPFRAPWLGDDKWITVPPQGYGGIQWIVKNLIDGLIELGHSITLLGAPGSPLVHPRINVIDHGEISDITNWLKDNEGKYDIVHDHSCRGQEFPGGINWFGWKSIHSHYLSSLPLENENVVAASHAHAIDIGLPTIPIVRHPVNPDNYIYNEEKDDYLLFLGRVSEWKGADLAASFAEKVGKKLIIAGPVWEKEYFDFIMSRYKKTVRYIGEVSGPKRLVLLSKARALLVFSKNVPGPAGRIWVEPGSTVVSESAASGTPLISSPNGCLAEIVPHVGSVILEPEKLSDQEALNILNNLPSSKQVYDKAINEWHHVKIARDYEKLYAKVLDGCKW